MSLTMLVCTHCAGRLAPAGGQLRCDSCRRSWLVAHGIPLLVEDTDVYVRTTMARAEIAKARTLGPLIRSLKGAVAEERVDDAPGGSLLDVLKSHHHNFSVAEQLLQPLPEMFSDYDTLEERDLDPHLAGYGPLAAFDYLLQDWRADSDEGPELARLHLPDDRRRRAVVLGSGAGRALAALAAHCDEVIGVDLSYLLARGADLLCQGQRITLHEVRLGNVRRASDRIAVHALGDGVARRGVRLIVADARRTPLPSGAADWVVASFLFDLLSDGKALVQEMRRLLRPGGLAVLMTTFGYAHDDPWTYYTPEQIVPLLEAHGLRVLSTSWHDHSYLNSPRSTVTRHSEMLRVLARAQPQG